MNSNSHLILDEFLEGRLSIKERNKFFNKLESDADLRQLVEAERIIKQSIIFDKQELDAVDHSATYSFLLAGLAATAVAASVGSSSASATTQTSTFKTISSSIFGGGSKTALLTLSVSIVTSVAIGIATYQLRFANLSNHTVRVIPTISLPIMPAPPPPFVVHQEIHLKTEILPKHIKPKKNTNNEVFHDIYGDIIESKNTFDKKPSPK